MRYLQMVVVLSRRLSRGNNAKGVILAFIFIIFSFIQVNGKGVSQPVSINADNTEIRQIIKNIEQQSDYRFFYTDGLTDLNRRVSMHFSSQSIDSIMSILLSDTQLGFRISNDKRVILAPRETMQQSNVITGTVTDKDGPVPGVNVVVKGTSVGTATDIDGKYSITVSGKNPRLAFSFLGYLSQEIDVNGKKLIDVTLAEDLTELKEVVVVGYGTVNKVALTGAVSSIGTNDLLRNPIPNVGNMLVGQVSGISAIQKTGQPGADNAEIYVRGIGTLNASNARPLMLVDGVERDFFQLDPNEIESISVLKDASATAVFGVQGANGVIIVTTRRGQEGAPKISVTLTSGAQIPLRVMKMTNSYEYGLAYNEMVGSDFFDDATLQKFKDGSDPLLFPSHDWPSELIKKAAFQTQDNINISGGTKDVKYFASLGYLSQTGLFKQIGMNSNFSYNRYNYRTNFDINASKTTKINVSLGGVAGSRQEPINTNGQQQTFRNIYWGAPFASAGIIDGKRIESNSRYVAGIPGVLDPFSGWYGQGTLYYYTNQLNLDMAVDQDLKFILPGLSAKVKYSYDSSYDYQKGITYTSTPTYTPWRIGDTNGWQNVDPNADPNQIVLVKSADDPTLKWYVPPAPGINPKKSRQYYWEASLNYAKTFGRHQISVLALGNLKKRYYLDSSRYNYPDIPLGSMGLVGRVSYNFAQRYLLDFDMGYNGSENFAPNKRFGFFPAVSVGWVASEEKFMENVKFISFLKLRTSIGKVGSDYVALNRFLYLPDTWNSNATGNNAPVFGSGTTATTYPSAIEGNVGNPDVTWETAVKQNYGLDISFFKGALSINTDVYFEKRRDILATRNNVPTFVAAKLPVANIGKVDNHGYEISIKWQDKISNKGTYWIAPLVSFNRNKIVFMDEVPPNYPWMQKTGHPVGQYYGLIYEGLYKSSDFPDALRYRSDLAPGDMKFTNLNDDDAIDGNDVTAIGYSQYPEYTFSLSAGINYKGFDFSMMWQGATHVSKMYTALYRVPFTDSANRGLMYFAYHDRFVSEDLTPNATYPRLATATRDWNFSNTYANSYWVKDATYARLKNVEVGYTFNLAALKKMGLTKTRIYVNGTNLLTFDKLHYVDPEEDVGQTNNTRGVYPNLAVVNFGINLNF